MNLCLEGHDEICYEGRECPACNLLKDRDYFDNEVGRLEKELDSVQSDLESADDVIKQQEEEINKLNELIIGLQSQLNNPASGG